MIIVASSSKPFTYNAKGFPRRTPVLRDYEGEIEALYAAVEQSSQSDIPAPSSWDSDGVKAFVEATVHHILGKSLPADADIFRNGCDRWVPCILELECDNTKPYAAPVCKQRSFATPSYVRCGSTRQPQRRDCQ